MKKISCIVIPFLVLISFSCAHQIPFQVTAKEYPYREGTLALVPGLYNDIK